MKSTMRICSIAILLMIVAACKEDDTTPPTVIIDEPGQNDTLLTGSNLTMISDLNDDRDLMNYTAVMKIKESPLSGNVLDPFQFGNTFQLFSATVSDTQIINIPEARAAGTYQLEVRATDMNANNSETKTRDIVLLNAADQENPQFEVTSLSDTQANTYQAGSNISVEGNASDNEDLGGIRIVIRELDNTQVSVAEFQMQTTATNFSYSIQGPSSVGTYNMIVTVADNVNNQREKFYTIKMQ